MNLSHTNTGYQNGHELILRRALVRLELWDNADMVIPDPVDAATGVAEKSILYFVYLSRGRGIGRYLVAKFDIPERSALEWQAISELRRLDNPPEILLPLFGNCPEDDVIIFPAAEGVARHLKCTTLLKFYRTQIASNPSNCISALDELYRVLEHYYSSEPGGLRYAAETIFKWNTAYPNLEGARAAAVTTAEEAWPGIEWNDDTSFRIPDSVNSARLAPNPFRALTDLLQEATGRVMLSRIHGDLNLTNVLLALNEDRSINKLFVIDLTNCESDRIQAVDFARLEVEIWRQVMSLIETQRENADAEFIAVRDFLDGRCEHVPAGLSPIAKGCLQVVNYLRTLARRALNPSERLGPGTPYLLGDYMRCLYFASLNVLKHNTVRSSPTTARTMLLSAALSLDFLNDVDSGLYSKGGTEPRWPPPRAIREAGIHPPSGVHLWQDEDRPPPVIAGGDILTGQRPQVHNLRDGFFADRPDVYGALTETASAWIKQNPARSDRVSRLPVFWIAGRSGSGKSVALLHVLARLHAAGHGPIVWLSSKVNALPEAIRWAREYRRPGWPVLIAIDDPYAPIAEQDAARIWRDAVTELESDRQSQDISGIPMILCCGPTEQCAGLEEDFVEDVLVTQAYIPIEEPKDLAALRDWYRRRVGKDPPDLGDGNLLLVQLFYEWRSGFPLREFASRFLKRLRGSDADRDLTRIFCQLLSLNRLYVGYPKTAFAHIVTPEQEGRLLQLRQELHLAEDASSDRRGVWFAHPHLANAMYESWKYSVPERREHLKSALSDCLEFGLSPAEQTAPLWAIANVSQGRAESNDVASRLSNFPLNELLDQTYSDWLGKHEKGLPLALLPVWIQIQNEFQQLSLTPDPVSEAVQRIRVENLNETGLRLTCHKLLEYWNDLVDHRSAISDQIFNLLESSRHWHEWRYVAADAYAKTKDPRFCRLINEWLNGEPMEHRVWGFMWEALWRAGPTLQDRVSLMESGTYWLNYIPVEHPSWQFIWQPLWDSGHNQITLARIAEGWLNQAPPEHGSWTFVWEALWKWPQNTEATQSLTELGTNWLSNAPLEHGSWTFVWEALWKAPQNTEATQSLAELGTNWLSNAPLEHGSWTFVWEALWKAPQDPEATQSLAELGTNWLSNAPLEHGSWTFVWEALWKAPQDPEATQSLAELGTNWLSNAPLEHGSWTFVWEALWRAPPNEESRKYLIALGTKRLTQATEDPAWTHVWKPLWEGALDEQDRTALRKLAMHWLSQATEHPAWTHVWKPLWEGAPDEQDRTALRELAMHWLSQATEHPAWTHVWEPLWTVAPDEQNRTALRELAIRWLSQVPEHPSWTHVWEPLWATAPDEQDRTALRELAMHWLSQVPEHSAWTYVWKPLWEGTADEQDRTALRELEMHWLSQVPEHPAWTYVWKTLWEGAPDEQDRTALRELAMHWLSQVPEHPAWNHVWGPLWEAVPDEQDRSALRELAMHWLSQATEHPAWNHVWKSLWEAAPDEQDRTALRELAMHWLSQVPEHRSWQYVWEPLSETTKDEQDRSALRELAMHWLSQVPEHPAWTYVWKPLWQTKDEQDRSALRELAMHWLSQATEHPAWTYVWEPLWEAAPDEQDRTTLRELTMHWLSQVPEHRSWQYIWEPLWETTKDEQDWTALRKLAMHWLSQVPEHHSWQYVWEPLWETTKDEQDWTALRELAMHWLSQATEHRSWQYVWEQLWKTVADAHERIPLRDLSMNWLHKVPGTHPSLPFVYSKLWVWSRTCGDRVRLEELITWLKDPVHQSYWLWPRIWESTWDNCSERGDEFCRIGSDWVRDHLTHPLASPIVMKAHNRTSAPTTEFLNLIPPSDARWPPTWLHIAKIGAITEEHWRLGINWLRNAHSGDYDQQLWPAVFVELWKQKTEDPELQELGCAWCQTHLESEGWPSVWLRLTTRATFGKKLALLGLSQLNKLRLNHNKWPQVWKQLWVMTSHDSQDRKSLIPLALKWLARYSNNNTRTQDRNDIGQMLRDAGQETDQLDKLSFDHSE